MMRHGFLQNAVVMAAMLAFPISWSDAASMSASPTAPVVDGEDIANYGTITGSDKWFVGNDQRESQRAQGQTFTTGDTQVLLHAVTYQVRSDQKAEPTKDYVIRVVSVAGTRLKEVHCEAARQTITWHGAEYMTWTFDTPVLLAAETLYGVDIAMTNSTSGWQTGIPYLTATDDEYAGGSRYLTDTEQPGERDYVTGKTPKDRIFHLDLEDPKNASRRPGTKKTPVDATRDPRRFLLIP